jgi:hypothetical protein
MDRPTGSGHSGQVSLTGQPDYSSRTRQRGKWPEHYSNDRTAGTGTRDRITLAGHQGEDSQGRVVRTGLVGHLTWKGWPEKSA